jgi:uncharacterized protein YbbC (DUF1343 family)
LPEPGLSCFTFDSLSPAAKVWLMRKPILSLFPWLVTPLFVVPHQMTGSAARPVVRVGAELLLSEHRELVAGKRVGIVTNHSAMIGEKHLIDLLHEDPEVTIAALFGPEHGLRGTADAGEAVGDSKDELTGAPVYSLYGQINRPTLQMLKGVEVLIFDMQDVGTRFYTYPATMGRAMISAAEAGIPFIVLDRPNPIGGYRIEGAIREEEWRSGIGPYATPVTHGMTVGELAKMIKGERWHEGLEKLDLHIVPMQGWNRRMLWPATGLPWVRPSPNLPDVETTFVYPGTCLFEGTTASEGRGTYEPFLQVGAAGVDGTVLADDLNARWLPGVTFVPARFTPVSIDGMSKDPKLLGIELEGVRLAVTDPAVLEPVALGIHLLDAFYRALSKEARAGFFNERGMAIRAGNTETQTQIEQGVDPRSIIEAWQQDVARFERQRKPYLIYD